MTQTLTFPAADIARTVLSSAKAGDRLRLTFAARSSTSPDEVREVTVSSVVDGKVYTVGGKVRPGNVSGGLVVDYGDTIYFQPTLAQPLRAVRTVAKVAA